jgi:hypothetical protein
MQVPTVGGSATAGQAIISIYTTGTIVRWDLTYEGGGGDLRLKGFDADGATAFDSGVIDFNIDTKQVRCQISLAQNGANIDWSVNTHEFGTFIIGGTSGTINAQTVSRCTRLIINPGGNLGDLVVGHIAVHSEIRQLADLAYEHNSWLAETAGGRIQRLCSEEGVFFRAVGASVPTARMGYQLPSKLIDLLREAADADGGILYEPRDVLGLAYRTRESMYNQTPRLTLDYSAKDLSGIEPTDDDKNVRNDITAKRPGGSSARYVKEDGSLSVLSPPDGVGRYDEEVTLNVEFDSSLEDRASWLVHLGTVDEARYPVLAVNLARGNFIGANQQLALDTRGLDVGDRLVVVNPPAWLPPDDITQLAQGFKEFMANKQHTIAINCSPESPWGSIGIYDDVRFRYSSDGTTTAEALDATETDVDVSTPSGPVWSHADGDFDIRVGGEVMTVTAVAGAGASQTFTVTRSVNGVVKSHESGATVELAHPSVYAI